MLESKCLPKLSTINTGLEDPNMATDEKKQDRGGVIPYYIKDDKIIMMFMQPSNPKFGGPSFQIAKGKVEKGESSQEGAFREAKEELGLFGPNITEVDSLGRFGTIHIYLAKIKNPDMFGDTTDETKATTWWTPEEFQSQGRSWQKPIVKAAARKIEKIENLDDRKTSTMDRSSRTD